MRVASPLEALPNEVKDIILDYYFAETPQDHAAAQKVELKVYTTSIVLRRVAPNPPPRFKGCRALMKTCKALYHDVLKFMYSRMDFDVQIWGNTKDPAQRYNRLRSEYPLGATSLSKPLQYIINIRLFLMAWSDADLEALKTRLSSFLDAIKGNAGLKIGFIGFYTKTPGSADELAKMLEVLESGTATQMYNQENAVSEASMQSLAAAIARGNVRTLK